MIAGIIALFVVVVICVFAWVLCKAAADADDGRYDDYDG